MHLIYHPSKAQISETANKCNGRTNTAKRHTCIRDFAAVTKVIPQVTENPEKETHIRTHTRIDILKAKRLRQTVFHEPTIALGLPRDQLTHSSFVHVQIQNHYPNQCR
jgi:hypothetical protein